MNVQGSLPINSRPIEAQITQEKKELTLRVKEGEVNLKFSPLERSSKKTLLGRAKSLITGQKVLLEVQQGDKKTQVWVNVRELAKKTGLSQKEVKNYLKSSTLTSVAIPDEGRLSKKDKETLYFHSNVFDAKEFYNAGISKRELAKFVRALENEGSEVRFTPRETIQLMKKMREAEKAHPGTLLSYNLADKEHPIKETISGYVLR